MLEIERGTILYGMMGCGKSTLGEGLATHLNQPFVDTDQLIEQRFGQSCGELLASGNFSEQQAETIRSYSPSSPEIVATGGSVAIYPELVRHLGRFGIGIFINVEPEALEARLPAERIASLKNHDNLKFSELYKARAEFYEAAAELTLHVPGDETADTTLGRVIDLRTSIVK